MFVVYLTMYKGNLLPQWYVGSSNETRINNGYNGSVKSKKYKSIYLIEQKENKILFKTRILSQHSTREEALIEELRLQKLHNVVKNDKYINMSFASINGFFGRDVSGKLNPSYGRKMTIEQKEKISKSLIGKFTGEKSANYDREFSNEWKENISKAKKGCKSPFKGKTHSKESIELNRIAAKNREKLECPYCQKVLDISNAKRWHFDNCKFKEEVENG